MTHFLEIIVAIKNFKRTFNDSPKSQDVLNKYIMHVIKYSYLKLHLNGTGESRSGSNLLIHVGYHFLIHLVARKLTTICLRP